MKLSTSIGQGRVLGLVPGLAVMAAAGSLLVLSDWDQPRCVQAMTNDTPDDSDGDGLSDLQEEILRTDPANPDTDGDGYGDAEELARKSSPLVPSELPLFGRMKIGSTMRSEYETLHMTLAVYLPTVDFSGSDLRIGIVTPRRAVEIPFQQVSATASVKLLPAQLGTASIVLIDLPFSPALVPMNGDLNIYATVGTANSGRIASAAVVRLRRVLDRIVYCMPEPDTSTNSYSLSDPSSGGTGGAPPAGGSTSGGGAAGGGTIYQPLQAVGDSSIPWSPGMICYQHSSPVGVSGVAVTYEVTQSECTDNWDAICPPSCSTSVGSTYSEIDPLGLLGG